MVPGDVRILNVLHFTMYQSMLAAQQTLLVFSECFPPSPVSALADDQSMRASSCLS